MAKRAIMVQLATPDWTRQAIHLACAMAYRNQTEVVLMRFLSAAHIGLVGQDMNDARLSRVEQELVHDCRIIAGEYHVPLNFMNFQYYALTDALVDAAIHLDAQAVFATIPSKLIAYWHKFEVWNLRRKLARANCELYTLQPSESANAGAPAMLVRAARK